MQRKNLGAVAAAVVVRLLFVALEMPTDELKFIRHDHISNGSSGSKWIVANSVQYPTESVRRLASLPGWSLVVVADEKTPKDWHCDGVHFLSIERQEEMAAEYSIVGSLPFKSYTRKNIGYLYAIAMGAEWIYDTDDDNVPSDKGLDGFDFNEIVPGLRFQLPDKRNNVSRSDRLFNPYRHFGHREMWPRGFPLENIQNHHHKDGSYRLCTENRRPAVQQGIVRKDPDVNAVYRLLNADKKSGLNEEFHPFAPPVIMAPGTFSPWNSQNTLFHRDAFFGLFLPSSVAIRVTDIWRSSFTQALLHLLDETVSFVPVNAIQERNTHNYLADFQQENDVYSKSGEIVDFIASWKCPDDTLEMCMKDLANQFYYRGYWNSTDLFLLHKWIDDLKRAGYIFPKLKQKHDFDYRIHGWPVPKLLNTPGVYEHIPYERRARNCRQAHFDASLTVPKNIEDKENLRARAEMKIRDFADIQLWCKEADSDIAANWTFPSSTQLSKRMGERDELMQKYRMVAIITNNYPWHHGAGLLQRLYESSFGHIIFCGTWDPSKFGDEDGAFPKLRSPVSYIHITETEMNKGIHGYICLNKAAELRMPNVEGYVMFSDDAQFNSWYKFDMDAAYTNHRYVIHIAYWWDYQSWAGNRAVTIAIDLLRRKYDKRPEIRKAVDIYERLLSEAGYSWQGKQLKTMEAHLRTRDSWMMSDLVFIPAAEIPFVTTMGEIFYEAGVFHEIFFSKLLAILQKKHEWSEPDEMNALLGPPRDHWEEFYNERLAGLHPIKHSHLVDKGSKRKLYCDVVLDTVHRNYFWK